MKRRVWFIIFQIKNYEENYEPNLSKNSCFALLSSSGKVHTLLQVRRSDYRKSCNTGLRRILHIASATVSIFLKTSPCEFLDHAQVRNPFNDGNFRPVVSSHRTHYELLGSAKHTGLNGYTTSLHRFIFKKLNTKRCRLNLFKEHSVSLF